MKIKVLKLDNTSTDLDLNIESSNIVSETDIAIVDRVKKQSLKQGTKGAKTRSQVRGGAAKPYKQKGTGRARQGSTNGPHFRGGGVAHGPVQDYTSLRLNKKYKSLMLKRVLSDFVANESMSMLELGSDSSKMRKFFDDKKAVLVVYSNDNKNLVRSVQNMPQVKTVSINNLSTFDLLNSSNLIVDSSLSEQIVKLLSK